MSAKHMYYNVILSLLVPKRKSEFAKSIEEAILPPSGETVAEQCKDFNVNQIFLFH